MPRYPSPYAASYSFGPGPLSQTLKILIGINVVAFLAQTVLPGLTWSLGLMPAAVIDDLQIWRLATYMFLHGGLFHLLLNMLVLWMFGTELERIWGKQAFLKFYFVVGVGAGLLTVLFTLLPISIAAEIRQSVVIGASGAIYGLLLAFALYFPDRPILFALLFPVPAKYFVMIIGAISLYSSLGTTGGVAHATHLGGLIVGYLYLKGPKQLTGSVENAYLRWKFNRAKRKFGVYSGGRSSDKNWPVH